MKLLVSDFDGTYFLNEEDIILNNEKIHNWRLNGNLFMLSSGRSFKSLKEVCQKYNIEYDYLSCCDGSILYDNNDLIINKYNLNPEILTKFLTLKKLAKIERIQYSYPDDYYSAPLDKPLIGCNIVILNQEITKKFKEKFYNLQKEYSEFDFLAYAHDEITYFCLKNKGINKSSNVTFLQDNLNLNFQDIYTVGDNENDYYMLKNFNGYYIGEVTKRIKKATIKGYTSVSKMLDDIEKSF